MAILVCFEDCSSKLRHIKQLIQFQIISAFMRPCVVCLYLYFYVLCAAVNGNLKISTQVCVGRYAEIECLIFVLCASVLVNCFVRVF
jgi:hypothetical protein